MNVKGVSGRLVEKGLKVTPQRIAVLEAIMKLNNHPTAENIIDYIRKNHPNISVATVYKVLEALIENGLLNMVKTERDNMRYDAILDHHHHIYFSNSDRIEDYIDSELNELLENYFERRKIPGFKIEDIKVQIIGKPVKLQNQEEAHD
jgi:Fur family transcriptional regulator, peroxide stress response regulator